MKVGKLYRGKQEKVLERYVSDTLARYTDIVKDEIFITHSGVSDEVARRRAEAAGRARVPIPSTPPRPAAPFRVTADRAPSASCS